MNLTAIDAPTVPVHLVGLITNEGLCWASPSVAATLAVLPVIVVGWVVQRQLVRGLRGARSSDGPRRAEAPSGPVRIGGRGSAAVLTTSS